MEHTYSPKQFGFFNTLEGSFPHVGESKFTRESDVGYVVTGYTLTSREKEYTESTKGRALISSLKALSKRKVKVFS